MVKNIKFSDRIIKYNTKTQEGFEEILAFYDRRIKTTVSGWVHKIPHHDIDDLAQICRMKLIEALEKYDDKLNINFSTYVYTIWHRKLAQLRYQYRTKKYSRNIENDNYVSFNYALDKIHNAFYLMLDKHKCPISREVIDKNTCRNCPHHVAYKSKEVLKGSNAGKVKKFTLCKYFMTVLEQRGMNLISLDADYKNQNGTTSTQGSLLNTLSSKTPSEDISFTIDFERIKDKMLERGAKIDPQSFIILQLMVEGFNKAEIIRKLDITNSDFNNRIKLFLKNKDIQNLIS